MQMKPGVWAILATSVNTLLLTMNTWLPLAPLDRLFEMAFQQAESSLLCWLAMSARRPDDF